MKISCEVIKDLLPLYCDNFCSDDSRTIVESHIAKCDNCRAELNIMVEKFSLENTDQNLKDAELLKKLSKRWSKGMLKSLLKGALISLITVIILALIINIFVGVGIF